MATFVLNDVRSYVGGLDATGQSNQLQLDGMVISLDATTFGSQGWMTLAGGLKNAKITLSGFAAYGSIPGLAQADDEFWGDLIGGVSVPGIFVPTSGVVGSLCYAGKLLDVGYKTLGKVGDLDPFELTATSDGPLARSTIMHPQGTARTTTGNGTGVQVGAVATGQNMYVVLSTLSITGTTPSLTVAVQSSVDNTFGAPTTRATFTAVTTQVGSQIVKIAGPITDTWWRVTWTIAGTTPSYLFAASAGVA